MLVFWLSAAMSVLVAGPAASAARPDRAAVEARLRANTLPRSAADWQALGTGIDEILIAIAATPRLICSFARAPSAPWAWCPRGRAGLSWKPW